MTPLQKLLRLKQITGAIMRAPPYSPSAPMPPELEALLLERQQIFSTVGSPPTELEHDARPASWAAAFVYAFPASSDYETALDWFGSAIHAGYREGEASEHLVGRQATAKELGMPELVDTLRLVRDGLKSGAITAKMIADGSKPVGTKARPLSELIADALAQAGFAQ